MTTRKDAIDHAGYDYDHAIYVLGRTHREAMTIAINSYEAAVADNGQSLRSNAVADADRSSRDEFTAALDEYRDCAVDRMCPAEKEDAARREVLRLAGYGEGE